MSNEYLDVGQYHRDQNKYESLVRENLNAYPDGVRLGPEYAEWIQENTTRLLIRLARYKFVSKWIRKSDSVLEVGSGSGLGSIYLGQYCEEVLGIDVKSSDIDDAKKLNKRNNVRFEMQDLFKTSQSEDFDVVVSLDVIEHMDMKNGAKFLEAKSRRIKKDGLLIVGTPSIYSLPYQSAISQASHIKCYDLPELQELVEKYFERSIAFSMNDELVHTGHYKMAWYYFVIGIGKKPLL
jgi:2-polyprenyl-3-methyl-5-hydroxy-6-metoxy-1,4-benzoquinol methylase